MKWSRMLALASACLLPATASASAASDSFGVATQELSYIKFLADNLTQSINDWDGKSYPLALVNIHFPANATCQYIKNATTTLKRYPATYDVSHSFQIGTPAQFLAYAVNASVATLNKRRPDFQKNSLGSLVVTDLQCLINATKPLSDLIVSYVQEDLKPVADNLASQFITSLQMGVDCSTKGDKKSCVTDIVDPMKNYRLAIDTNAMYANGKPIA